MRDRRGTGAETALVTPIGRRAVLRGAMATAGALGLGRESSRAGWRRSAAPAAERRADRQHARARSIPQPHRLPGPSAEGDRAREDDPRQHVRERGGGIASIDSARILRQLAKEQGGKPEATIWFDGTKVPVVRSGARQRRSSATRRRPTTATSATPPMKARRSPRRASPSPSAPAPRGRTCSAR